MDDGGLIELCLCVRQEYVGYVRERMFIHNILGKGPLLSRTLCSEVCPARERE